MAEVVNLLNQFKKEEEKVTTEVKKEVVKVEVNAKDKLVEEIVALHEDVNKLALGRLEGDIPLSDEYWKSKAVVQQKIHVLEEKLRSA